MTDAALFILLVEDEPAHAEAIRLALQGADPQVVVKVAGTLREYREIAAARPPDVAVMDLILPDGRAVEALASPPEAGPFPILIITSYGSEQLAVEAIKAGALDYIVKSPEAFADMPHIIERTRHEWSLLQERMRADEALRASLREKEVLLREIHHRVRNNMQVISSLLNLQVERVKDGAVKEILKESQNRIRSIALVHERMYNSTDLARVDFSGYIPMLYGHLGHVLGIQAERIKETFQLESVFLGVDLAIPCGLILTELISNSMTHAFPGGRKGTLRIELRRDAAGLIRLVVADDGAGLPPNLDFRKTESLGLQIVNMLAEQIGAQVELLTKGGTRFTLTFRENRGQKRT
jgi:two-component sensor histidine kinase